MNRFEAGLRQAAADLDRHGRSWAIVGGFAVAARAEPRTTRDVDVAVSVEDDSGAEDLVRRLITDGYTPFRVFDHDNGRLATVRLERRIDGRRTVLDLLFASSGIEREIAAGSELLEVVPGVHVPVAATGHLIAVKVLARDDDRRPQDLADLRALLAVADADDLALARESVALIQARGFNRERDLPKALDDLVRQHRAAPDPPA